MSNSKGSENYANNIHKREEVSIPHNLLRSVIYICIHRKNNEMAVRWVSTVLYFKELCPGFFGPVI